MAKQPLLLAWRLRVVMAEREIRTTRALCQRLAQVGVVISEPQLGRIVKALPRTLNLTLLAGLCTVLDVTPGELLIVPGRRVSNAPGPMPPRLPASAAAPEPPLPSVVLDPANVPAERPRASAFPRPKYDTP
ncbi:helix-turn-helix domain-containing protein [Pseudoxanthomonas mexicana]